MRKQPQRARKFQGLNNTVQALATKGLRDTALPAQLVEGGTPQSRQILSKQEGS